MKATADDITPIEALMSRIRLDKDDFKNPNVLDVDDARTWDDVVNPPTTAFVLYGQTQQDLTTVVFGDDSGCIFSDVSSDEEAGEI